MSRQRRPPPFEATPELRERIQAMRDADPELWAAAYALEAQTRRDAGRQIAIMRKEERLAERGKKRGRLPMNGRFRAITSGRHSRQMRPQSAIADRKYVPGALRHWRKIHGLSTAQAQDRIGYSVNGRTWAHWEAGYTVPPYATLLLIITATGMGLERDDPRHMDIEPRLLLDFHRRQHLERQAAKRMRRAARGRA